MSTSPHAKFDMHLESPPQSSNRTAWEKRAEDAKITFHKTVDGHYHGKSGYKKVACLLITWRDDDMKCKETEVDALHKIFAESFHFETEFFEIPSVKEETALNTKVANFLYEYDSPDNMVIIYYAGHGYVGEDTKQFKLAAKASADRDGDPTAFFNDVLGNLRLACCDQLLILDCCHAEKAFTREHEGKSKFELFTSVGPDDEGPPPGRAGSFTAALNNVLRKLLSKHNKGFSTSQLYRELYHTLPATMRERPHLFDLAKNTQERIWLRPLKTTHLPETEGDIFLNVTIRLKVDEDTAEQRENLNVVMNRLAYKLQYLQDVDQISFKYLSAPKARLQEFRRIVLIRQKLLPILERIRSKLRQKEFKYMFRERANKQLEIPHTAAKMFLEESPEQRRKGKIYDWSGELGPKPTRKGWLPWPEDTTWTRYMTFGFFSLKYKLDIPKEFSYFSIIMLSADRFLELTVWILFVGALLAFLRFVAG